MHGGNFNIGTISGWNKTSWHLYDNWNSIQAVYGRRNSTRSNFPFIRTDPGQQQSQLRPPDVKLSAELFREIICLPPTPCRGWKKEDVQFVTEQLRSLTPPCLPSCGERNKETLICNPLLSATPPLLERLVEPNVGLEKAIEARTHVTANRSEARPCIRECPEKGCVHLL